MTTEMWSLLLQIVIGVLIVGYGIWLRYIISQQLKTKDTVIQALEAVIKTKDAQISRLQADSAPAIAEAYDKMRKHADHMTEQVQSTTEQLRGLNAQHAALFGLTKQYSQTVEEMSKWEEDWQRLIAAEEPVFECDGLLKALVILHENLGERLYGSTPPEVSAESIIEVYARVFNQLSAEIESKTAAANELLEAIE